MSEKIQIIDLRVLSRELNEGATSKFASVIANYILGQPLNIKIKGSMKSIETLKHALIDNKSFYQILMNKYDTKDDMFRKFKEKAKNSIKEFEHVSNIEWPL